jgi:hypothetical protein
MIVNMENGMTSMRGGLSGSNRLIFRGISSSLIKRRRPPMAVKILADIIDFSHKSIPTVALRSSERFWAKCHYDYQ